MSVFEFAILCQCLLWNIFIASRSLQCSMDNSPPRKFYLVRKCQRASVDDALALENTVSLDDCIHLTLKMRGMAFNYAPIGAKISLMPMSQLQKDARSQLTVWQQPAEFFNCHVLQCPQNISFSQMINDSRFDYYSLYGRPPTIQNYSCVPKLGLFILYLIPTNYLNASRVCSASSEFSGSLAHIASPARTNALAQWIVQLSSAKNIFLAFVGLKHNNSNSINTFDFRNAQEESLLCFFYRAWELGYPSRSVVNNSSSCIALTSQGFWQILSCDRQLPFICEIHTLSEQTLNEKLDIGQNSATDCHRP